jgi:hypothetical protein
MKNSQTRIHYLFQILFLLGFGFCGVATALDIEEASASMEKAVKFFREEVGYQGAYLYQYSADLKKQEGEGLAFKTTGWVKTPGTP